MCPLSENLAGDNVHTITIRELVECMRSQDPGDRLLLPPIQRSLVWTNAQIIHYWDSLLRGYPAGLMMVHRSGDLTKGRDRSGETVDADANDFLLFDGQQRMMAILLGLGEGPLERTRKLWIDIGADPEPNSELLYQLRISSSGQPFGYQPDHPNSKVELRKRSERFRQWQKKRGEAIPFTYATGCDLIDATCAIPLAELCKLMRRVNRDDVRQLICGLCSDANREEKAGEFVDALAGALESQVILGKVPSDIVNDPQEYVRFFTRLGQGGTRLSDDELTFSIIKNQHPFIHDRIKAIVETSGRLASEVDLVLSALRAAKILADPGNEGVWNSVEHWKIIGRPNPEFAAGLDDEDKTAVREKFLELIPEDGGPGLLQPALNALRTALSYAENWTQGFPPMLLAQIPRELLDVLVLLAVQRGEDRPWEGQDRDALTAFVLYWLLFMYNDAKAAWKVCERLHPLGNNGQPGMFGLRMLPELIDEYERDGVAWVLPRIEQLGELRTQVDTDHPLRPWAHRFTSVDSQEIKPGEALRVLSTDRKRVQRALMWLQRRYIYTFAYDPTSDRDEDLPIDLDHLIPQIKFQFDWRSRDRRLDNTVDMSRFYEVRGTLGHSLGNFRWLGAQHNRERQDGPISPLENVGDLIGDYDPWNALINKDCWGVQDVVLFQRQIDRRTLNLYEKLLQDSGIVRILPPNPELAQ